MKRNYKTSYGVIAYSKTHSDIKFLLVQKKHSHSYVALIRGHYSFDQPEYIRSLISKVTPNERIKLLAFSHDYLWEKLWSFSNNNVMFKREHEEAKRKFSQLVAGKKGPKLSDLFKEIKPVWNEPELGFPKGKKFYNERESESALREFLEETGINSQTVYMHSESEIPPIYEEYIGDDGVNYRHIYYLAKSELPGIGFTDPWSLTQVGEIGKIGWFSCKKAIAMLRPYHTARIDTLQTINDHLIKN